MGTRVPWLCVLTVVGERKFHFVEVDGFAVVVHDHGRGACLSRVVHLHLEAALAPAHQRYPRAGHRGLVFTAYWRLAPVPVAVRADHVQQHPGRGAHVKLAELADLRLLRLHHGAGGHVVAGHVQVCRGVRVGRLVYGGRGRGPRVRRRDDAEQRPHGQCGHVHGEPPGDRVRRCSRWGRGVGNLFGVVVALRERNSTRVGGEVYSRLFALYTLCRVVRTAFGPRWGEGRKIRDDCGMRVR